MHHFAIYIRKKRTIHTLFFLFYKFFKAIFDSLENPLLRGGGGGLQNRRGWGSSEVLPLQKRGDGKGFIHPEGVCVGGGTTSFGVVLTRVVLTRVLEVLTILPPPPPPTPEISDQSLRERMPFLFSESCCTRSY